MADTGITPTSTQVPARRASSNTQPAQSLLQLARTPVARQLLLLVGIAAAVALGLGIVLWSRGPNLSLLYTGLAPKDAANIVQTLQANQTPYKLGSDGTSIFVPASEADALRLRLAAQGLPQGSASSEAISAPDSAFGMSDTQEANRDREVLEQNLERSIASLQSIRSAHVQLALPAPSAFIRDDNQPSASVLVELYPGRQLSQSQVAAIVHLVAASVPNLDPSRVSVVDQEGQLLTAGDTNSAAAALDNQRMGMTARMENAYAQRVQSILAPLVGANHVHAEVHVDLDFKDTRLASEVYGKGKEALRSEQVSSSTHSGADAGGGGVPGALSNQPPVTVQQPTAANPSAGSANVASASSSAGTSHTGQPIDSSNQATRNYEVDRTISYTNNPAGDIQRLSVAVIVDYKQVKGKDGKVESVPLGKAELAHLTELVQSAVGYDAKRGDVVSVVNEPFHLASETASTGKAPFWQAPGVMDLVKQSLGVIAALLLAFGLLRPMMRGLLRQDKSHQEPAQGLPGPQGQGPARVTINETVTDRDDTGGRALPAQGRATNFEQRVGLAKRVASENPRQVAQIVKDWVATDGA
ncbi:MAG TPA: flagellar basal-body MS-ring/collar protein FliF [Rhodanobacteraceae bacterium]|nr:flagellar basal-body MS-ring/collar protein FliF [Rhodanobacteraceae bacterium]